MIFKAVAGGSRRLIFQQRRQSCKIEDKRLFAKSGAFLSHPSSYRVLYVPIKCPLPPCGVWYETSAAAGAVLAPPKYETFPKMEHSFYPRRALKKGPLLLLQLFSMHNFQTGWQEEHCTAPHLALLPVLIFQLGSNLK